MLYLEEKYLQLSYYLAICEIIVKNNMHIVK